MKIIIESSHSYKPKCKNWCIPRHDSHLDSCETWLVYYSFRAHQLEIAILEVCVLHSLGHRYPFTVHLPHSSLSCHNISLQAELFLSHHYFFHLRSLTSNYSYSLLFLLYLSRLWDTQVQKQTLSSSEKSLKVTGCTLTHSASIDVSTSLKSV